MLVLDEPQLTSHMTLDYDVELEGTEQIVVNTFDYDQQYNQSTKDWVWVKKEPMKFVLKQLDYSLDYDQFSLDKVIVVGFRKDKKLRARHNWIYPRNPQFLDIVAQIPDHFHDKARAKFAEAIKHMKVKVETIERNGVKIK